MTLSLFVFDTLSATKKFVKRKTGTGTSKRYVIGRVYCPKELFLLQSATAECICVAGTKEGGSIAMPGIRGIGNNFTDNNIVPECCSCCSSPALAGGAVFWW